MSALDPKESTIPAAVVSARLRELGVKRADLPRLTGLSPDRVTALLAGRIVWTYRDAFAFIGGKAGQRDFPQVLQWSSAEFFAAIDAAGEDGPAALPPDIEAARSGLAFVDYDGIQEGIAGIIPAVYQFTVRDPAFPESQPTFYVNVDGSPLDLLSAYAETMRKFGRAMVVASIHDPLIAAYNEAADTHGTSSNVADKGLAGFWAVEHFRTLDNALTA